MLITNSTDITELLADVIFDLSQVPAVVKVHNRCTGANLNLVKLAFELYDPNDKVLHQGNFVTPDALGDFAVDYVFTEPLTEFDGSILWSGNPYRFVLKAKDSAGNEYTYTPEQTATICKPAGNANVGKNFGEAKLDVKIDCNQAEAKIIDLTSYSYKGITGTLVSKTITVLSPPDNTGIPPSPVIYSGFSAVLHPLTFTGKNFSATISTVVEYDIQNGDGTGNTFVILRFIKYQTFDVSCNYDICPLLCRYSEMLDKAAIGCSKETEELIQKIAGKMVQLILAKEQATCGYDIGAIIEEIKTIAGWHDCNCECNRTMGLNGIGITTGLLNIQFVTDGDISGTSVITGNNILLTLKDYSYVFKICDTPGSNAFVVKNSIVNRTKTYCLDVDLSILADEILDTIAGDVVLKAKFIAIYGNIIKINVDPKCIPIPGGGGGGKTCNYELTAENIPAQVKFGSIIFSHIVIDNVTYYINLGLAGNTVAAIQTALNALGLGTFTCVYDGGTFIFTIVSNGNTHSITDAVYITPAVDKLMSITKICSGTFTYDPSTLIQAIIDYICGITGKQVKLGGALNVCHPTIDKSGNIQLTSFDEKNNVFEVIEDLSKSQCEVIAKLLKITDVTDCEKLKTIFKNNLLKVDNTTVLYGLKEGDCSAINLEEISGQIWEFIYKRKDFCSSIQTCIGAGGICVPVTDFIVEKTPSGTSTGCALCGNLTSSLV